MEILFLRKLSKELSEIEEEFLNLIGPKPKTQNMIVNVWRSFKDGEIIYKTQWSLKVEEKTETIIIWITRVNVFTGEILERNLIKKQ